MKTNWVTQQTYERLVTKWKDIQKKPQDYGFTEDEVKLVTTPGQTYSVKEIIKRYEKGRPITKVEEEV